MKNETTLTLFEQRMATIEPTPEWYKQADEFAKLLNKKPKVNAIKTNKFANNSEYLEVGYMEMKLDQITKGLWNTEVKSVQLIGNSICCTVRVEFFHLHYKVWIHREGVGACPIEVKSGSSPVDFSAINAKAITKNLPVAKTEAFKNAMKSVGNLFGRHLNRQFQFDYVPDETVDQFVNPLKQAKP